jgi:hypothetical protein
MAVMMDFVKKQEAYFIFHGSLPDWCKPYQKADQPNGGTENLELQRSHEGQKKPQSQNNLSLSRGLWD